MVQSAAQVLCSSLEEGTADKAKRSWRDESQGGSGKTEQRCASTTNEPTDKRTGIKQDEVVRNIHRYGLAPRCALILQSDLLVT